MHSRSVSRFCTIAILLAAASTTTLAQHYQRVNLTTDSSALDPKAVVDPNLVNAWGLSRASFTPWWVSDNGTGLSTLYDLNGTPQSLVVTIPPAKDQTGPSAPTGTVYNYTGGFEVAPGMPALFLFVTENGTIAGWNPNVNLTMAVTKKDRSAFAAYKGCALAMTKSGPRLYATNFKSGRVEVFNSLFQFVTLPDTAFRDPQVPRNYVPFNIQNVGGNLVVTFAHREPGEPDEDHGPGVGYVSIFDPLGRLIAHLQHGPWLNAPWGVAMSPSDFGVFSHRLLIGNFGDGKINAFNPLTGKFIGQLLNPNGLPIHIDGLWAISFGGDNARSGQATDLFFTAGPNDENNGLFGKISALPEEQRGNSE